MPSATVCAMAEQRDPHTLREQEHSLSACSPPARLQSRVRVNLTFLACNEKSQTSNAALFLVLICGTHAFYDSNAIGATLVMHFWGRPISFVSAFPFSIFFYLHNDSFYVFFAGEWTSAISAGTDWHTFDEGTNKINSDICAGFSQVSFTADFFYKT